MQIFEEIFWIECLKMGVLNTSFRKLSLAYLPLKLYEKIVIKSWCISGCVFCENCVKMSVIYSKFHYGIKNKVENLHI